MVPIISPEVPAMGIVDRYITTANGVVPITSLIFTKKIIVNTTANIIAAKWLLLFISHWRYVVFFIVLLFYIYSAL